MILEREIEDFGGGGWRSGNALDFGTRGTGFESWLGQKFKIQNLGMGWCGVAWRGPKQAHAAIGVPRAGLKFRTITSQNSKFQIRVLCSVMILSEIVGFPFHPSNDPSEAHLTINCALGSKGLSGWLE